MSETTSETNENTGAPKSALGWAMAAAQHASTVLGVVSGVAGAWKLVESVRAMDRLPRLRFWRREGVGLVGSFALLGAGVAVGAGLGLMLAPASGAKMRRRIRRRIDELAGEDMRALGREPAGEGEGGKSVRNGRAPHHHPRHSAE